MRGFFFFFFFMVASLCAEEAPNKGVVLLAAHDHYVGDYFGMGQNIEISGEVVGDVYVIGGQVIVDGKIQGDLLVIGGSVDLSGEVSGNVRAIGGQVLISGVVGKNVTVASGNLQLLSSALIQGNVVAACGSGDLSAQIAGRVTIAASHLRVASTIGGNVDAYVGDFRLTSKARIAGDLDYKSGQIVCVEMGAQIQGKVSYSPSLVQGWLEGTWLQKLLVGSKLLGSLMNFFYSFVVGLILIRLFPDNLKSALRQLDVRPFKALAFGAILLVALPLVSLLLLMTILGAPFALTLIAANIIGFYTAKIYTIYWIADWLSKKIGVRARHFMVLGCGLILYFCLTAIPFVGQVIAFIAMLLGVGSGVLASTHSTSTHKA